MSVNGSFHISQQYMVHDFEKELKWSELPVQYIRYLQAIVYWWPKVEGWDRITDLLQQKQGKDITLSDCDGKQIKLQFKSRRSDFGDFLIEYRHDYFNGGHTPGWIEKDGDIDYLIYCLPKRIFRIEWQSLKSAWDTNKVAWINKYDLPPASNSKYDTRNIAVCWETLQNAGVKVDEVNLG